MNASSYGPTPPGAHLITVGHLLAVLRGRWKSFAAGVLVLLSLGIALTFLLPKRYTATATVLVDVRSPDPISGALLHGLITPAYMNTQIDLLKNASVARRAVAELRWLEDTQVQQEWRAQSEGRGDAEGWAARQLLRGLKVAPAKDSNLLDVDFTDKDPAFAAKAANAFVKAYVDTSLALRHEPAQRHKQLFEANAQRLRQELDAAQARLSAFEKDKGITADDRQIDVESARLLELSSQFVALQSVAADSRIRKQQGATNSEFMQDALASPLITGLRADLQRTRTRLKEMLTMRGENHPQVVELRESVAELERRIKEETGRSSGGVDMSDRVNQQRVGDLRASLEQQRARVAMLKSAREQALSLRRDVENAQKSYDTVASRGTQMGLESQIDQTNVSVVGWATLPGAPSSPKVLLNIAGSLILGVLTGLCVALWRESRDRRIRVEEELTALVRQPLLVSLPRFTVDRSNPASAVPLLTTNLKRQT
jgi:polysaccharide biosynthesis transport protein